MSRALKYTLLIGVQVSLLLTLVHAPGLIRPLDAALARMLGLSDQSLNHPAIQYLTFIVLAFGIAWTTIDINRPASKILVAAAALAEVFTLSVLMSLFGGYFSPVLPAAAVAMAFSAAFLYASSRAGQRQRVVDSAFGPRVSLRQMRALVDGRSTLNPEGQLEELSLVVCEIFNHQHLMDALEPEPYAALCNRFLDIASDTLVEKGGTLAGCDADPVRAAGLPPDPILRMAALLTGSRPDFAARLKLSTAEAERLVALAGPPPHGDDDDLRRQLADTAAEILIGRSLLARQPEQMRDRLRAIPRPVFPLEGRDVLALGLRPGPAVGALLRQTRAWWRDGGCVADATCCRAELARLASG